MLGMTIKAYWRNQAPFTNRNVTGTITSGILLPSANIKLLSVDVDEIPSK